MKKTYTLTPEQIEDAARLKAIYTAKKSELNLSQLKLGEDYEIGSQGMVWQYLNGKAPLNVDAATKFANALKTTIDAFSPSIALSIEKANKVSTTNFRSNTQIINNLTAGSSTQSVPLLKWEQTSVFIGTDPRKIPHDQDIQIDHPLSRYAYALRVTNDFMTSTNSEKSIQPNSIIIVDPDIEPQSGDLVIVLDNVKNKAALRLYSADDLSRRAFTTKEPIQIIDLDNPQFRVIGVVKESILHTKFS